MKEQVLLNPIKITSSIVNYEVIFKNQNEIYDVDSDTDSFYIIDANVKHIYYQNANNKNIITLSISEDIKNLSTVEKIIEQLRVLGANKKSTLIVIGGGITQDIGTMVASIFMRGITWILVPTTFLSLTDSCVGGKSSINVSNFKNIAGNFYPPHKILIYAKYCSSLEKSKIIDGLCEATKIIFAVNPENFISIMTQFNFSEIEDLKNLSEITYISLLNKKKIIEEDEFDEGIRLLLNFGHTFGHAIESASKYQISHGVAIGLGILLAINYSENKHSSIINSLNMYIKNFLYQLDDLTKLVNLLKPIELVEAFENDKKHLLNHYRVILPNNLAGNLEVRKIKKNDIEKSKFFNNFVQIKNLIA